MINFPTSSQIAPISKKIQHKKHGEKKTLEFLKKIKACQAHISFFIDPLLSHRIYRDFLVPNNNRNEPIYHFKSYLAYKSLSQVHIREEGVALQFNDYLPDYITPMGLLQKRLDSVGNTYCHDLAQYLPKYYENFEGNTSFDFEFSCEKEKIFETEPYISQTSTTGLLLKEIDKIFLNTLNDVVLITVYQEHKPSDDRLHMLSFNKNLIHLLTAEENFEAMFESDLVDQLLEMFKDYSFDHYMEEFSNFIKTYPVKEMKEQFNPNSDKYARNVNTIFGLKKLSFCLKNFPIEINGNKYRLISSIVDKEDRNFLLNLLSNKNKEKKNDDLKKQIQTNKDWSQLFQIYYCHDKQI